MVYFLAFGGELSRTVTTTIMRIMKIIIKATNLGLTEALKIYIERRMQSLEKFISAFDNDAVRARIEVARSTRHHKQGNVYHVDVNLELPGAVLRAEKDDSDIRAAIDAVKDKLKREIEKYKGN